MNTFDPKGLSVITIPMKMKKQIEKIQKLREISKKTNNIKQIRRGDTTKPIITCSNSKLNHYRGQTYGKFDAVSLASMNWTSKKTKNQTFVIHSHSQNPAFSGDDNDSIPSFEELGLDPRLVEQLKLHGYEKPTNIQKIAIPAILEGKNTVVAAETGNGKTLSFLAPIVHKILQTKESLKQFEPAFNSPQAVIIVPSRELVAQTRDFARELCDGLDIRINSIFGGRTKGIMMHPKVFEHDILIGSFGAVSKLITNSVYRKNRVNHLVLDEADTLLDDSFNDQMKHFLSRFALNEQDEENADQSFSGVQFTLVGATFPTSLQTILKDIIDVNSLTKVKTPYLHRISPHVTHTFHRVGSSDRLELLIKLAKKNMKHKIPTIIFCNTSACSNYVYHFLNDNHLPCMNVNGNMEAHERVHRFKSFQDGEYNFISCTDLVSRGLNTVRAQNVVNFEFPTYMSDYIHRCGRTGRVGGGEGHVTNFIYRPSHIELVQKIEYACRKVVDLPNVNANIKRYINVRVAKREVSEHEAETTEQTKKYIKESIKNL